MFLDEAALAPLLLISTLGLLVAPDGGRAVELVFFARPLPAVGVGVCCTFGQVCSSTRSSPPIFVFSFVPSLVKENFAQLGNVIRCCCCTRLSISFWDVGFQGSTSF